MALTVFNPSTLRVLAILNRASVDQGLALARLATVKRIDSGADDPAGLIALNSLNSELAATNAALDSTRRADSPLFALAAGIAGRLTRRLQRR